MTDINSRIAAAREQAHILQQQIQSKQRTKQDESLMGAVQAKQLSLAQIRKPPATKLRRTLKGHFGKITAIHWGGAGDPEYAGQELVSASQDGIVLLWNAQTTNKVHSISLKSSYVMAVGLEPTRGNFIACGGLDNLCTIYKRSGGAATEMASHDGFLSCCRFVWGEDQIVTSSGDSTCILWDVRTATPVSSFAEHEADAMFVSIQPGSHHIFCSGSVDKTVKIWDTRVDTGSVQTFSGFHSGDINCVEFMPSDCNCVASSSQDNTCRLFDMRAYNELARFRVTPNPSANIAGGAAAAGVGGAADANYGNHNNNNNNLAGGGAAGMDGTPRGARGGAGGESNDGFTSLSFSRSGRLLFCGHSDGSLVAFDILASKTKGTNPDVFTPPTFVIANAHEKHVSCVGVSPRGDALCTASWDGTLKIWA